MSKKLTYEELKQRIQEFEHAESERKQAEEALQQSEARYRSLFEGVPMGLYITTPDGKLVDANQALVKMLGYPDRESLLKIGVTEHYVNVEDRTRQKAILESGEFLVDFEVQLRLNDGTIIWAEDHARPVCDAKGRVLYYEGAIENITERKQVEEALKESQERFKQLFETAQEGIAIADNNHRIIHVNSEFTRIFGYEKEEAVGKLIDDLIASQEMRAVAEEITSDVSDGKRAEAEGVRRCKDGSDIFVSILASPIKVGEEQVGVYGIYRNITERKRSEEALRKYASNMKILLQEVNHRVKNNLSAIISMVHMEQDRAEAQGLTSVIPVLQNINDRIGGLATVHSLLSSYGWQPLKICDLCQEVVNATLQGFLIEKSIDLEISPSPLLINSNQAHHLTLVINELATNTIKYGMKKRTSGSISIKIKKRARKVKIIFSDDGPGYPDEVFQKNFTPSSIGFNLIKGITRQNLRGEVVFKNKKGAFTQITFPYEYNDTKKR